MYTQHVQLVIHLHKVLRLMLLSMDWPIDYLKSYGHSEHKSIAYFYLLLCDACLLIPDSSTNFFVESFTLLFSATVIPTEELPTNTKIFLL